MSQSGSGATGLLPSEPHLLDILQGFVHELRTAGLPVSMTENLDAMRAVEYVPLTTARRSRPRSAPRW